MGAAAGRAKLEATLTAALAAKQDAELNAAAAADEEACALTFPPRSALSRAPSLLLKRCYCAWTVAAPPHALAPRLGHLLRLELRLLGAPLRPQGRHRAAAAAASSAAAAGASAGATNAAFDLFKATEAALQRRSTEAAQAADAGRARLAAARAALQSAEEELSEREKVQPFTARITSLRILVLPTECQCHARATAARTSHPVLPATTAARAARHRRSRSLPTHSSHCLSSLVRADCHPSRPRRASAPPLLARHSFGACCAAAHLLHPSRV